MHLLEWMEYLIRVKRTGRIETGPDFDNRGAVKRIDEDRAELTEIGRELLVVLTERLHMEQRITALEADLAAAREQVARVRVALEDVDARGAKLHISDLQEQYWYGATDVSRRIRAALDPEVGDDE
jgi:chorismate mutase